MKRKEAIEKIKALGPKDAINTKSENEARLLCKLMNEAGLKWLDGTRYTNDTFSRSPDFCYYIPKQGLLVTVDHAKKQRTIQWASDFIGGEEDKEKTGRIIGEIYEIDGIEYIRTKDGGIIKNIPEYGNLSREQINLHSTVNQMGKIVTQEVHIVGGLVRTIEGIETAKIEQGTKTILPTKKADWKVNTRLVNYVKIKGDSKDIPQGDVRVAIFHFKCGEKLSLRVIIGSEKYGEFIKLYTKKGYMYLIQDLNLAFEECIK